MAEKDDKAGGSAPSDKKNVTDDITKSLKEAGQKAAELAQNPVARNMFAAGLVTAAAALTANKKFRGGVKEAGKNTQAAASNTVDNAGKIGAAIISAATDAVKRLLLVGEGSGQEETIVSTPPRKAAAKKGAAKKSSAKPAAAKSAAKPASRSTAKKPAAAKSASPAGPAAAKPKSRAKSAPKKNGGGETAAAAAPTPAPATTAAAPNKSKARKSNSGGAKPAAKSRAKKSAPASEGSAG